jgi:hypothetical protein
MLLLLIGSALVTTSYLVAGLTAAGMPGPVALPSVFRMRLATFWLPILPGWACFTWLRCSDHV